MFVDEVEPEEAVMVSDGRIAKAGQDVPRRGDGEKQKQTGERDGTRASAAIHR